MFRHTLSAALSLLLLFALLSAATIAVSNAQPPNPALAGFERCDYGGWCWLGIRPGVTTVREADQLLREAGYERTKRRTYFAPEESGLCDVGISPEQDSQIIWAVFFDCGNQMFKVGDFVSSLANPTAIGIYDPQDSARYAYFPRALLFDNATLVIGNGNTSLFNDLNQFSFSSVNNQFSFIEWDNFNYYDYCRIEPSAYGCP